jgi:glycosyltransferase involved in cell wall biosynthesis
MGTLLQGREPLVSVIVPYYNQPQYVRETVRSALNQTYRNIEIIVVDDGSPIPVEPVLEGFEGIRIFREENRGSSSARNFGFRKSKGEYIIFLDHDDLLRPDAAEVQMRAFQQNTVLTFGAQQLIDQHGRPISRPHVCRRRKEYFLMLLESNPIGCAGAAMIRRQAFIDAGLFDESTVHGEDYDLYLRLTRLGPLVRHTHCVVDYRQHAENASSDKERMLAGTMRALDKLEKNGSLTAKQRRRLRHGRKRWLHVFRPRKDLLYRVKTLYFSLRAMFGVPLNELFRVG